MSYQPPFTITSKILFLVSDIVEIITDIKHIEVSLVSCEFIHPFRDGNGRVGRLWQSVILNHYKKIFGFIPIESVVREHQASYYKALEASGSAGESTPFIEYMLEIILKTLKNASNENVPKNVPKKRLDEIVKLIEKNKEITSIQIAERLKVSDKTIKRDMATLKEQGRLQRVGSLKSGHWEVLNDEK